MRSAVRYTKCAECGVPQMELDLLEEHIKQEHLGDWRPFSCGYCDTRRFTEWRIREHLVCEHPLLEPQIMFTDDEAKSLMLSEIVMRSMEKSERHRSRRRAPRVSSAAVLGESSIDTDTSEYSIDRQPLKTPMVIGVTTDDDGSGEKMETFSVLSEGQSTDQDEQKVRREKEDLKNSVRHQSTGNVATPTIPASRRNVTVQTSSASNRRTSLPANLPSSPPAKRHTSINDNPTTKQTPSPDEKKRKRRTTTIVNKNSAVLSLNSSPNGDWFSVPGSTSRWYRCKLCKELVSVKILHTLQKHLTLPVYRCTARYCPYTSHYSTSLVKQHIKAHHPDQGLHPADDTSLFQEDIDEMFAKCF